MEEIRREARQRWEAKQAESISRAAKRPKIDSSDNEIPAEVLAALMASGEDLSAFDLPGMHRNAGVSAASSSTSGAAAASRGAPAGIKPPPPAAVASSEDETAVGIMKRNQTPTGVFRLLTWNIDGLDQDHDDCMERLVNGVISVIPDFAPDAVLLQEVVQPALLTIKRFLSPLYEIFAPNPPLMEYFSAIMVRKSPRIKLRKHKDGNILQRVPFPGTQMGRELLFVEIMIDGIECYVSTAHLESQKIGENQRKLQLDRCLKHLSHKSLSNDMSFFGGDLNLRDPEASAALGKLDFPDCLIRDAWELDGCNQDKRFTWDLQRNNNIVIPGAQLRCRFDRLYVAPKRTSTSDGNAIALTAEEQQHAAEFCQMKGIKLGGKKALTKAQVTEQADFLFKKKVKCKRFTLMGCERLEHGRFPSDHFGILSEWELVKDGKTSGSAVTEAQQVSAAQTAGGSSSSGIGGSRSGSGATAATASSAGCSAMNFAGGTTTQRGAMGVNAGTVPVAAKAVAPPSAAGPPGTSQSDLPKKTSGAFSQILVQREQMICIESESD